MTLKEYLYIVFHPVQAFAKLRAYISLLEDQLGVEPTQKGILFKAKPGGLTILGDDTIVKESVFQGDSALVIHPDAKRVMVMYCHFIAGKYPEGMPGIFTVKHD